MEIMDDGIRLSAALEMPVPAEGKHPLVIFLHGFTSSKDKPHNILSWISNTLAAIDAAGKLDGVGDLYLSGHSQGGLVAALAAGMAPDRVKGLILRAPAFMIPRCAREGYMLGFRFDPFRIPEEIEVIKGLTLKGHYIRVAQTLHAEDAIKRFTNPVLILHGDEDDTVPLQDSVDAARKYKNCRLEIIQGETHHFDRRPEEMKRLIREWLRNKDI